MDFPPRGCHCRLYAAGGIDAFGFSLILRKIVTIRRHKREFFAAATLYFANAPILLFALSHS
jgi:hypothetical protein